MTAAREVCELLWRDPEWRAGCWRGFKWGVTLPVRNPGAFLLVCAAVLVDWLGGPHR